MKTAKLFASFTFALLLTSCGSKAPPDDEVFSDVEFQDVKDQDSLSLDTPEVPKMSPKPVETATVPLALFIKSEQALKVGPFLWSKKFNPAWLAGCVGKRTGATHRCVIKNGAGERAIVVVKLGVGGFAQRIFIDTKGEQYPDFWEGELSALSFNKVNDRTFASGKSGTRAKIVYVKKAKAATLILEKI